MYIQSTCFTWWVTSKEKPSPMTTTHDSLYFLSIASFTSRAAASKLFACFSTAVMTRSEQSCRISSVMSQFLMSG